VPYYSRWIQQLRLGSSCHGVGFGRRSSCLVGKLTMLDGKTGKPRTIIDIEKAAKVCVKEGPLRFAPYEESRPERAPSPETPLPGIRLAEVA
jgi:hypothetical protein